MPYSFDIRELDPDIIDTASWVLGLSSSLVQGLLSFGGMLAIWPGNTFRAMTALLLTIAYEGEINRRNSKAAIVKFSDPNHIKFQLTKQYLENKLQQFDQYRARFTLKIPTEDEQKKVCLTNEFVFIRITDDHYEVGFRNSTGDYEQQRLSEDQCDVLKGYSKEQFIENEEHIAELNTNLKNINIEINKHQSSYPLYIKQYIAQLRRTHNLRDVLENHTLEEADKDNLAVMEHHLNIIEQLITDSLFNATEPSQEELPSSGYFYFHDIMKQQRFDFNNLSISEADNIYCLPCLPKDGLNRCYDSFYNYHKNELIKWIEPDQKEWQAYLIWHKFYSLLAIIIGAISGIVMAIGTCYLLMEALATIPLLALIPAIFVPYLVIPLAIISGIGYGQQVYTSIDEMLTDNPFKKFIHIFNPDRKYWTLKTKLFLGASVFLFVLSTILTLCTIGTWITVFHQTLPFLSLLNYIPSFFLNYALPIFIGLSDLPFTLQSIANTLEGLENHPTINGLLGICSGLYTGTYHIPTTWTGWRSIFYSMGVASLGLSIEEFEQETPAQQKNIWRILLILFKVLSIGLFLGHLFCTGEMTDRFEGFPVFLAVTTAFILEFFQDFDYFAGHAHIDVTNTLNVLKERFSGFDEHNHDDNLPMMILKTIFTPIFERAAAWSHLYKRDSDSTTVEEHLQRLQGIKPRNQNIIEQAVPDCATESNHQLFLFKSAKAKTPTLMVSTCCQPNTINL